MMRPWCAVALLLCALALSGCTVTMARRHTPTYTSKSLAPESTAPSRHPLPDCPDGQYYNLNLKECELDFSVKPRDNHFPACPRDERLECENKI